ncbi:MAG: putative quinol monooxygenase [Rhizomicrobium sp.]
MLLVTGRVTAKPGTLEEMLRAAREHVHRSRTEPGCISHDVSVDADDPLTLHFIERWHDEAALKAHFRVPESRAFWQLLQKLAADPGAMRIYDASETRLT